MGNKHLDIAIILRSSRSRSSRYSWFLRRIKMWRKLKPTSLISFVQAYHFNWFTHHNHHHTHFSHRRRDRRQKLMKIANEQRAGFDPHVNFDINVRTEVHKEQSEAKFDQNNEICTWIISETWSFILELNCQIWIIFSLVSVHHCLFLQYLWKLNSKQQCLLLIYFITI